MKPDSFNKTSAHQRLNRLLLICGLIMTVSLLPIKTYAENKANELDALNEIIQRCPGNARFVLAVKNLDGLYETWQQDARFKKDLAPLLELFNQARDIDEHQALTQALGMTEIEIVRNFFGESLAIVSQKPPQENDGNVFFLFKPKHGMLSKGIGRLAMEELVDLPPNLKGIRVFRTADDQAYLGVLDGWCYMAARNSREFLRNSAVTLMKGKNLSHRDDFTSRWKSLKTRLSQSARASNPINPETPHQIISQGFIYSSGIQGNHVTGITALVDAKTSALQKIDMVFLGDGPKWRFTKKLMKLQKMMSPESQQSSFVLPAGYALGRFSMRIKPNFPRDHQVAEAMNRLLFKRQRPPKLARQLNFHEHILPKMNGQIDTYLLRNPERLSSAAQNQDRISPYSWFVVIGQNKNGDIAPYFNRAMKRAVFLVNFARASREQAPLKLSQVTLKAGELNLLAPENTSDAKSTESIESIESMPGHLMLDGQDKLPFFHGLGFGEIKQAGKSYYVIATDPVLLQKIADMDPPPGNMKHPTNPLNISQSGTYDLGGMAISDMRSFMKELNQLRGIREQKQLDDFEKLNLLTNLFRSFELKTQITPSSDLSVSLQINR